MSVVPQALPTSYPDPSSMLNTAHIVSATTAANIPKSQGNSSSSNSPSPVPIQQSTSSSQENEIQSLDNDKKAIYRHPLFPLMALLFEKCERATQTPECPSADSFDVDIQAFVQHQEKDRKPFFSDDTELDGLMVKAIQVLRIHLLELEKVNELCKDFCNRYITCLKSKLQSEHLLRTEVQSPPPNFDGSLSGSSSGSVTPTHTIAGSSSSSSSQPPNISSSLSSTSTVSAAAATLQSQLQQQQQQQQQVVAPMPTNNVLLPQGLATAQSAAVSMGSLGQGQIGGTVYRMVQTPQGIVAQPIQIQATPISNQVNTMTTGQSLIHGSTPLSQIGIVGTSNIAGNLATSSTSTTVSASQIASLAQNSLSQMGSDDEDILFKRKTKRGILPKTATKIMKSWLFQHIVHPYPTEDEKRQIAAQTNLTLLQVNNWFINARRRILQPMLDSSNSDHAKVKKNKPQNRPLQRFWPDNIANLRPQMPLSHEGELSGNSSSLSPGGCGLGGAASSNDSSSIITSNQPSNPQNLVVLSMPPTATTSTTIVPAASHLAMPFERLRPHQVAVHCPLPNSPQHSPIIIENSNDTNTSNSNNNNTNDKNENSSSNTSLINRPSLSITTSRDVTPSTNKDDKIHDKNNNHDDEDDDNDDDGSKKETQVDPLPDDGKAKNLCFGRQSIRT